MRVLFMGTPAFAAASLEALLHSGSFDIAGVVTQPDRPKGRGMTLQPSEVKLVSIQAGLPLWQPSRVADAEFMEIFEQINPDVVVVVAFGQKIPDAILFGPRFGCINVHGSLLPKYRGAAPIQWSILNGDASTGITTMYMDQGWDTGDIIYQETLAIAPDEDFASLYQRMARLGGELLVKTLQDVSAGIAPRIPQDSTLATLAPKIKSDLEKIDWTCPGKSIYNGIRVFAPSPGAETFLNQERLKIIAAVPQEFHAASEPAKPGEVLQISKEGIVVATGDTTSLCLTKVQPLGKKVMSANDFANGRRLKPGMIFGKKDYIIA
jgi:methionyl-tRNA formyltransferase